MIVLDTDIATLLSYGKTDKLNKRIAALDKGERIKRGQVHLWDSGEEKGTQLFFLDSLLTDG